MNDLSPEARRTLAQAKSAQPRASEALRARVKENVLLAVAAAAAPPPEAAISKSAFAKLPAWTFPTLGAIAVIGGIATFAAQSPTGPSSAAKVNQRASHESQPSTAQRELAVDARTSQAGTVELQASGAQREAAVEARPNTTTELQPSEAQRESAVNARALQDETVALQPSEAQGEAVVRNARTSDGDLRAEMQLLARAEAALRANKPLSALSILETHAHELSSGQLQGERDGLRLIAQCTLGRAPQSALARYLREHPDGVLQARIRTSCARFLQ